MDYSKYEKQIEEKIAAKIEELLKKENITVGELNFLDSKLQSTKIKQLTGLL